MQRDLFLVLTILGSSLCLLLVFLCAIFTAQHGRIIVAAIAAGEVDGLMTKAKGVFPLSVFSGVIFVCTWICYRRYHRLAFPDPGQPEGPQP